MKMQQLSVPVDLPLSVTKEDHAIPMKQFFGEIQEGNHYFHLKGWDVYCFEANPTKIQLLKEHRHHVFQYAITDTDTDEFIEFENVNINGGWTASFSAIKVSEKYKQIFGWNEEAYQVEKIKVQQKTLNSVIREQIPELTHIDIMSLDIEGYELNCLRGLDLEKYPPKVIVIENVDHDVSIPNYLRQYGYVLNKQISYNEYYLHESYLALAPLANN